MNLSFGLTAWRDERSLSDAIKHHDRAGLAVAISLAVSFLATLLKGKYAQYAAFLDPDTVAAVGVLVAGAVAGFGHWAAGGALASAAGQLAPAVGGPIGVGTAVGVASTSAPVGSISSDPIAPAALRPVGDSADNPGG